MASPFLVYYASMFSAFALSQILIGIAFLFDLASFQFKDRRITLFLFTCAASLISAHFFLLGATTAGVVIAVSATRFFVSIFTTHRFLKYFFLILIGALGVYTFDGYEDAFSITAGLVGTFAAFQENEKRLRELMMLATTSIIIHNLIVWTPAGILLELFFLSSNALSYYRFYLKKPIP